MPLPKQPKTRLEIERAMSQLDLDIARSIENFQNENHASVHKIYCYVLGNNKVVVKTEITIDALADGVNIQALEVGA